jgi:hypothetical protein
MLHMSDDLALRKVGKQLVKLISPRGLHPMTNKQVTLVANIIVNLAYRLTRFRNPKGSTLFLICLTARVALSLKSTLLGTRDISRMPAGSMQVSMHKPVETGADAECVCGSCHWTFRSRKPEAAS